MKRLTFSCAFLLALVASVTAWSLCAFLIALISGSISSSLVNALTPALPTPILSTEASVPVTNTELHVSFKQPQGWTLIESGIERNGPWRIPYAIYGIKRQPDAPTLKITYQDSGTEIYPGKQDIIVSIEVNDARYRGQHVVEELRETIDGLPAGGVIYVAGRKVVFKLFATQPTQSNDFMWMSDEKYSSQLEQIYQAMLPTITFVPPTATAIPIITATPPSGDTYLHPLRPTPHLARRTPQPDIILGAMLSPELNTVVRGALSLLKACSPETWAFVHQYAYAINAPPTPQMNYHMVRYSGVVLLSQTDLFRWPSQSLQEFAAMAAIVHQSRHLWQSETHFIADPDVLERDAYRFELQVFDNPTCVSTVPTEDRASLAVMRRTVEESIKNPPTPP